MMAIMAWPQAPRRLDPKGRIGTETAGLSIEPELQDDVGTWVVARRLQHVVLEAGDVGHKREAVRWVGRNRMRPNGRFVPIDRLRAERSISFDPMHRHERPLVIGGEQIFAGAIRREK